MVASRQTTIGLTVEQIWAKGQGNALIINTDLVNSLFVSQSNVISANDISIPPLGSMGVDGTSNWYASTLAAFGIATQIAPGVTQWTPSPAQVAAQINALGLATLNEQVNQNTAIPNNISTTGVPLLSLQSQIASQSSLGMVAGASVTSSVFNVANISFEFVIAGETTVAADATPYALVVLQWIDSVSGLLVSKDSFVMIVGSQIGLNVAPHLLKGPNKGDQVKVTVHNFCTVQTANFAYTFLTNSRIIDTEQLDMVWNHTLDNANSGSIPYSIRDYADSKEIAFFLNGALGAGNTDTFVSPPHNGPAWVNFWETGVAGGNIQVTANPLPTAVYGNTPFIINDILVAGNPNKLEATIILPMGPVQWTVKNAGSVNANYSGVLVAE